MGAGQFAAGYGFAGADPVAEWSPAPIVMDQSMAALFDLATKSVLRDETTGLVKRIHVIDQTVALAMGVRKGSITSAPDIGNELHLVPRNNPRRIKAVMTDEVRRTLKSLVDNGDIQIVSIDIKIPIPGRNIVILNYVNLHTNKAVPLQVAT